MNTCIYIYIYSKSERRGESHKSHHCQSRLHEVIKKENTKLIRFFYSVGANSLTWHPVNGWPRGIATLADKPPFGRKFRKKQQHSIKRVHLLRSISCNPYRNTYNLDSPNSMQIISFIHFISPSRFSFSSDVIS